jgi:hypothetical protein
VPEGQHLKNSKKNAAQERAASPRDNEPSHRRADEAMAGAWGVIASLVPAAELPALEIAVGCSLIEKCTDLRNEADALRDIVEDYAQQNARDAESEDARAEKRAQADRLGDGPEREMLERKVFMLLDYLGGAGSEAEKRVAAYVRRAAADRARQVATPPKKPSTEKRTPPPAPKRPMDALADLFIDRGDSSDVVKEARRLLEREAEDLVEEIARLTTFFDEEERAVCERHRRTPTKKQEDKPSLQDLRRVSQKLEKRWLQQEHARDVKGLLKRVPGGAIVDSPISFGKSKLVGELLESPATVRKTASPEGGRLAAAPPRRTKPKNRLREKMTQAREEKFLQEW